MNSIVFFFVVIIIGMAEASCPGTLSLQEPKEKFASGGLGPMALPRWHIPYHEPFETRPKLAA